MMAAVSCGGNSNKGAKVEIVSLDGLEEIHK